MKTRFLLFTFLTLLKPVPRQHYTKVQSIHFIIKFLFAIFEQKGGKEIVFRPGTRFPMSRQSLQNLTLFRQKSCISLPCRENLFYEPDSKTQSLRTQTSDDWRYVCVRRLKDSEKPYPVQRHIWKCPSGLEYPRDHISHAIQQNKGLFTWRWGTPGR